MVLVITRDTLTFSEEFLTEVHRSKPKLTIVFCRQGARLFGECEFKKPPVRPEFTGRWAPFSSPVIRIEIHSFIFDR